MEEDYTDTHMCLACQTTFIGLDNYIIHKRNGCPAGKQVQRNSKLNSQVMGGHSDDRSQQLIPGTLTDIRHLEASLHDAPSMDTHTYQNIQHQVESNDHYGDNLTGASPNNHDNRPGYISLPTCQNQSAMPPQTGLATTAHHNSNTYLQSASQQHMPLEGTDHSISSLLGVHSTTEHYHSEDRIPGLNRLQTSSHSLATDLGTTHTLPSIRTFRSCNRLLPSLRQDPTDVVSPQALHSSLPFSHVSATPLLTAQDDLNDSVRNDLHAHHVHALQSHTATSSGMDLSMRTPNYTTPLTNLSIPTSHAHHIMAPQSTTGASIGSEVSDAVASFVSNLSPNSSRVVDPNIVLYEGLSEKDTTFTDFFSSLELQYRVDSDSTRHLNEKNGKAGAENDTEQMKETPDGKFDLDHNKALHIASILNELAFSSDSDNILPSDTEHLFDSTDEDNEADHMHFPPPTHTGGKWVPGQKLGSMKSEPQGKWAPIGKQIPYKPLVPTGKSNTIASKAESGKQRTGLGRGKAMGGKLKSVSPPQVGSGGESEYEDPGNVSDDEQEEEENLPHFKGKHVSRGKVFPSGKLMAAEKVYFCKPCDRTLLNKVSYERHCSTTAHIKKSKHLDENKDNTTKEPSVDLDKDHSQVAEINNENIECSVCEKSFNNRYNFARHLISSAHQKRALNGGRTVLLDESYQLLLSRQSRFQCHICQFYCNTSEQFNKHLGTEQHEDCTGPILGPLLCVRCKFACRSNAEMLDHIESEQHNITIGESDRPCVLRESRYRVQCRSCESIFHSATALKKHMETTHQEIMEGSKIHKKKSRYGQPPICHYCEKRLSTHFKLEIHIRRKHTFEKPFHCDVCDKSYSENHSLTIHKKSKQHMEKAAQLGDVRPVTSNDPLKPPTRKSVTHKCKKCDFVAENYKDLRPHFLKEHLDSVLECTTCGVHFVTESAYNTHMSSNLHRKTEEEASHSTKTFVCVLCEKKFYCSKKFMLHKLVHQHVVDRNSKVNANQVRMSSFGVSAKHNEFLESIQNVPYSQRIACPVCGRNITKQQMYTHLRIHDGASPFGCIYCIKTFSCPKTLMRHLAIHLGVKSHICSVCNRKFTRERALVIHQRVSHGGDPKRFKCEICGVQLHFKWRLRQHLLEHVKPVKCRHEGCSKTFSNRSKMMDHFRKHSGEKPFLCDQCGYRATSRQLLTRHRRTHTGERKYQCEYCSYRAMNSTNLNRHMRIHIGSKPYKCPYCAFTCNTHENIRKHVMKTKKHAGKSVYPCRICNDFGTNSAAEFKKHLAITHLIENKEMDLLSEYAGLYNKGEDTKTLPEGARAIPSKERNGNTSFGKNKQNDRSSSTLDHDYTNVGKIRKIPTKSKRKKFTQL